MSRGLFGPGTYVLGGGAVLLLVFLAVGYLLPTTWTADATLDLEATSAEVLAFLDSPEGWRRWTTWPDSGVVREGPERGSGATLRWADPELGSGSFTIEEAAETGVRYTVLVDGPMNTVMRTDGAVVLEPSGTGTRVRWHEEGDLGRTPLMGYWARFMGRAQSAEMEKGLARLSSGSAPSR